MFARQESFDLSSRLSRRWSDNELIPNQEHFSVVILGATGSIATNKTFPALFRLFASKLLPSNFTIYGFTRTNYTDEEFREFIRPLLGAGDKEGFLKNVFCFVGKHGSVEAFRELDKLLLSREKFKSNRLFYFAIPGSFFTETAKAIKETAFTKVGWNRIVVEKPFGIDQESHLQLSNVFDDCFGEENVFRMDHYLGKEMVQSILALRFSNIFMEAMWNHNHIEGVHISLHEDILVKPGTFASYFEEYGVVRDLLMDHLLSLLVLIAMEPPLTRHAEDIRNERVKVLRAIPKAELRNMILGQYEGYHDLKETAPDSVTPTYVACVLHINNPRWWGVPFIITTGKGLANRRSEIKVQFKRPQNQVYEDQIDKVKRNELIIRIFPDPNIEFNMMGKIPGIHSILDSFTMNMTYGSNKAATYAAEDYERLLYDVFRGKRTAFVRSDESQAAWKIFGTAIKQMENEKLRPLPYLAGSNGPRIVEELFKRHNFKTEMLSLRQSPVVATALQKLQRKFFISVSQLTEIVNNFGREFQAGLEGKPSTVRMLPTYVQHLPSGDENGVYYALDLGGTNFRVSRFSFQGNGHVILTDERKFTVPDRAMTGATPDVLFDFLAECMMQVTGDDGPEGGKYGFTFSFPVEQTAIDEGRLITWTKQFKTKGVVGKEVVALLRKSLAKVGLKAQVKALVNDTVGTLAAKAYTSPRCFVGLIIGTGTNAAYVERVENVKKLPEEIRKKGGDMVINTEWGAFGEGGARLLPVTEIDAMLDRQSRNPNKQTFEKMVSGAYLGEVTRICFVKLVEEKALWSGEGCTVPDHLWERNSFESRYMSEIEYDMSPKLSVVEHIEHIYGVKGSTHQDRNVLKEVCAMVAERAARLTACGIAAAARQLGERGPRSMVGIDGSVFENHPSFAHRLRIVLDALGCNCDLALSKDGSGKGAALIAAAVHRNETQREGSK